MHFSLGTIFILFAAAAVAQNPPDPARVKEPPSAAQSGGHDEKESDSRTVVDVQTGKPPINATLLNRSDDANRHETYFLSDPTKRSGVMIFCDDALGTTIGVVATDLPRSNDLEAGWQQERRFWQDEAWCINVTSLGWSEDGRFLFVATSDIYGNGNVYQLDLEKRRAAVIFPQKSDPTTEGHCWSTHIDAIGTDSITVHARDYCDEDNVFARETLPFLTEAQLDDPPEKTQIEKKDPEKGKAGDLNRRNN